MSRSSLVRSALAMCAAASLVACGDANVSTGDGGRDGGRDEAWNDGGDGTSDGGDLGDGGEGTDDGGGATGGPFATCEACSVTADCEPGASCVGVAGGLRACVKGCDPASTEPADACPSSFACEASFPGAKGASCIPAGLLCCIDEDGDGFGQGVHCRAPDCDDQDRKRRPDATEACNGIDDDCDGVVPADEADADHDGFRICDGDCDDSREAIHPRATETCDGLDDDCDDVVPTDEADVDRDGVKACEGDCNDGDPLVKPGAAERCNGISDACAGAAPANEDDADGDGTRVCAGDCDDANAAVHPGAAEVCDGLDDDCNGSRGPGETDADHDTVFVCAGDCNDADPAIFPNAPEICDGKDNDCSGGSDDTRTTCGTGACERTVDDCADGLAQVCIEGLPTGDETCNGIDDDCDGETDEGFTTISCGVGACARTVSQCDEGASATCTPGTPVTETCNGIDDDCDGVVDDGNPGGGQSCETGLVGVCAAGVMACTNGALACSIVVAPASGPELCNGLDDDCDGSIDEGSPQTGTACSTGEPGVCGAGVARCSAGQLLCDRTTAPTRERCDGLDNDCNGLVDDGLGTVTCGVGGCQRTINVCQNGVTATCTPNAPTTELCNGIDDNCNGAVDEGQAGVGVACSTGLPGACATGTAYCGVNDFSCTPNVTPGSQAETCDGVDNDCDGLVDEGNPGGGRACNTGLPGVCTTGVLSCSSGSLVCLPTVATGPEVCDGVDNDCNGQIDEGLGTISCGIGLCARTVPACIGGRPGTCTAAGGSVETCNGIDDNCDGLVDNGTVSVMCPAPNNVTGSFCSAGVCGFTGCSGLNVDADQVYGNGCECEEDTVGSSSGGATGLGTVNQGGVVFGPPAVVTDAVKSDWYAVTFPLNAIWQQQGSGTPTITFTQNGGNAYRFEVFENSLSTSTCSSGTTWSAADTVAPVTGVNYGPGAANPSCPGNNCAANNYTGSTCPGGLVVGAYNANRTILSSASYCGCVYDPYITPPSGQSPGYVTRPGSPACPYTYGGQGGEGTWGLRARSWPTTVWIRVFRASGRGCERYQLRVTR